MSNWITYPENIALDSAGVLGRTVGAGEALVLNASQLASFIGFNPSSYAPLVHTHGISDVLGLGSSLAYIQSQIDGKAALSHSHAIADVTGLQTALDGKAALAHSHAIADVTGLQTALDGKAASSHTHSIANVTGLQTALDGKAALAHSHAIADVTGLQTALDGKAASSHAHSIANVTGLQTALDGKAALSHSHAIADVTGLQTALDDKISLAGSYSNPTWITGLAWSKISGITGTPDGTKFLRDDGSWQTVSGGGGGITSLGGQTGAAQTFQVGTNGTNFTITSSANVHTFDLPDASATARGLVTTGSQTFAGAKTFSVVSIAGDITFTSTFSLFSGATEVIGYRAGGSYGLCMGSGIQFGWASGTNVNSSAIDVALNREGAGILALRNDATAQTLHISNTWTSGTNFEYGRLQWNTNEFRIGTAVGSTGGTQRLTILGSWNTAGAWAPALTIQTDSRISTAMPVLLNNGSHASNNAYHFASWNNGCIGWASTGTITLSSALDTAFKRVSAGLVEINNGTAGTYRDLVLRNLRMSAPTVPVSSTDTGSEGQVSWDANYIYVCTATNTWKRATLATW